MMTFRYGFRDIIWFLVFFFFGVPRPAEYGAEEGSLDAVPMLE